MSMEDAGGVVTAGLVGAAISKPTGEAGDDHTTCSDCGAEVSGKFCSNCGQATHVHRSLLHLVEEVMHGVLHFDARIWRTLPLLAFNPGRLTREWIQGRRTRYVSPLAIFLFTIFLMFFTFGFSGPKADGPVDVTVNASAVDRAQGKLDGGRGALAGLESVEGIGRSETAIRALRDQIPALEAELAQAKADEANRQAEAAHARAADPAAATAPPPVEKRADGLKPGSWQAGLRDAVNSGQINLGDSWLAHRVTKKLQNPDLALYKIQQTAYKFSFLLIPISIPFVALLFLWRRGFTLYDHGVFVLYSLTAVSLLFVITHLLGLVWSGFATLGGMAIVFGIPVHMFAQLKGTYGLSVFSALWRTVFLLMFCVIAVTLFLAIMIAMGVAG